MEDTNDQIVTHTLIRQLKVELEKRRAGWAGPVRVVMMGWTEGLNPLSQFAAMPMEVIERILCNLHNFIIYL